MMRRTAILRKEVLRWRRLELYVSLLPFTPSHRPFTFLGNNIITSSTTILPISPSTPKSNNPQHPPKPPLTQTHSHLSITSRLSRTKSTSSKKPKTNLATEIYPETDLDAGLVGWEGQSDALHPRNYPEGRKWMLLGFVSGITFLRCVIFRRELFVFRGRSLVVDGRREEIVGERESGIDLANEMYSPLSSSVVAPGISFMDADFHNTSSILSALTVSIFLLGFAVCSSYIQLNPLEEKQRKSEKTRTNKKQVGPLILSPLSEIYGRRPILIYANIFLTSWQLGCALAPNLGAIIAMWEPLKSQPRKIKRLR